MTKINNAEVIDVSDIAFYVVQNDKGEFFRRKGHGGYGKTWVEDLDTARVWTKIGGARSVVTFFANDYPQYPVPKIIKLTVAATEVIEETARITAVKERKRKEKERRELRATQQRLKEAQENFDRAKTKLEREQKHRGKGV